MLLSNSKESPDFRRGEAQSQPLPFIPGLEGAGTVEAIGQDVRGLKVRFESQDRPES